MVKRFEKNLELVKDISVCYKRACDELQTEGKLMVDAVNRIYVSLNKEGSRRWILDADISGCFDNISHTYLMNQLAYFPYKEIIFKWLKAGIVYESVFFDTEFGTPQGSIISPLLCNIALHGMEEELGVVINKQGNVTTGSRSMVRYADDFVVLCYSKEDAYKAKCELEELLGKRGLTVSEAKTRVRHAVEGFDFLGFTIRITPKDGYLIDKVIQRKGDDFTYEYDKTLLLIKPSLKSINNFKNKVRELTMKGSGSNAETLINRLNPIIRGWAQSKIYWHCNRTFHDLDHFLFNRIVRFIRRSHPNKSWKWLREKYFKHKQDEVFNNKWVFHTKIPGDKPGEIRDLELLQLKWFKPLIHIMVRNLANPMDPSFSSYFNDLTSKRLLAKGVSLLNKSDQKLVNTQGFRCPVCDESLFNGEKIHKHHIIPRVEGGKDLYSNLIILHLTCHYLVHHNSRKEEWRDKFLYIKKVRAKTTVEN
jgi:RNA-directed DNA polymerase